MIPSAKVATYDLQPEMSADAVCKELVEALRTDHYDYIVCNFANPDMVGHTGVMSAAIKACESNTVPSKFEAATYPCIAPGFK